MFFWYVESCPSVRNSHKILTHITQPSNELLGRFFNCTFTVCRVVLISFRHKEAYIFKSVVLKMFMLADRLRPLTQNENYIRGSRSRK